MFSKLDTNKLISLLFLLFVIIVYIYRLDHLFNNNVNHATSWWLSNYEYGLTKRGLLGQIFYNISFNLNISILDVLKIFQICLFSLLIFLISIILINKQVSLFFFIYLFSPVLFLSYINDIFFIARQEIFLFIFYILNIFLLKKKKIKFLFIFNLITFPLMILIHELSIFYFSYFFTLNLMFAKNEKLSNVILKYLIYFFVCLITLIFLLHNHNPLASEQLCKNIIELGGHVQTCNDLQVSSINHNIKERLSDTISIIIKNNYLKNYFIYMLLSIVPFLFIKKFLSMSDLDLKKLTILIFSNFLFSLPLFILAYDWGRWLHIHFMTIFIILINFLPNDKQINSFDFIYKKILFLLFLFFYIIIWAMPVCCEKEFRLGLISKLNYINKF